MISLKTSIHRRAGGAILALLAVPLAAQSSLDGALSHRVIPGWQEPDGTRIAGLELTLAPGWKTYWRSPGDAGIPPSFDWRGARNLSGIEIEWPTPTVFWQSGMRSVGYRERVVLPLRIQPKRQGREVHLRGNVALGLCSDICVPTTLSIDAVLPPATTERSPEIVAARAALPFSEGEAGVTSAKCSFAPAPDGLEIVAEVQMPPAGTNEEAVIETSDPEIWVSEPDTHRNGNRLTISAEMIHQSGALIMLERSDLRITVIGGSYSVDIQGCSG